MANNQNLLKPEDLTPEQRRENARKAGIASAKAKKERKNLKSTLELLLSMPMKSGEVSDLDYLTSIAEAKGKNLTAQDLIALTQVRRATKGDIKSIEFIQNLLDDGSAEELNIVITRKEEKESQ